MQGLLPVFWVACGAWSLSAQSLIFRQAHTLLGGWEMVLSVLLSFWLVGVGVGVLAANRLATPGPVFLVRTSAAGAVTVPLSIVGIRLLPPLLGLLPGEPLPPVAAGCLGGGITALAGLPMGMLFVANYRLYSPLSDRGAALVYAAEGLGAAIGGSLMLAATLLGVPDLPVALLLSSVMAVLALLAAGARSGRVALAAAAGCAALAVAAPVERATLPALWGLPHGGRILSSTTSPYGWTLVTRRDGQVELRHSGLLSSVEPPTADPPWTVHPAAASIPDPSAILVAGGESLLTELLKHPVRRLDYAPFDPALPAAWAAASRSFAAAIADARVRVLPLEARGWLSRTADRYDLILIPASAPVSLAANRLLTEEFLRTAASHLRQPGRVCITLPSPGAGLPPATEFIVSSLLSTMGSIWPHVVVAQSESVLMISAGPSPAPPPDLMVSRLIERGIEAPGFPPEAIASMFDPVRAAVLATSLSVPRRAPVNRDGNPAAYRFATIEALGRFHPSLAALLPAAFRAPRSLAVALSAALCLALWFLIASFLPGSPSTRSVATLMGAIGSFSLCTETILMYLFQSRFGTLYGWVGILLGLFMAGLAAGGVAGTIVAASSMVRRLPAVGLLAIGAIILYGMPRGLGGSAVVTATLIGLTGFLDGLAYPWLLRTSGEGSAGTVYAADVIASALGNLVAAVAVIPLWGPGAGMAMMMLLLGGAVLLPTRR